uniref:BTB domain-containing protein n=1 Tax=Strongyloides papillosus TaxID=174720 RepID=A0A0N5CGP5_STREA
MSTDDISYKFSLTSPTRGKIFWSSDFLENLQSISSSEDGMENKYDYGCLIPFGRINESMCFYKELNIVCEIKYKIPNEGSTGINIFNEKSGSRILDYERHGNQLYDMYKSVNTSDCTIVFHGKFFFVHKFILMAHSLAFRKLFMDPDSKESKGSCVTLCDTVESQAVEMMVNYLYKGELPSDIGQKQIKDLLHLAVTYKIDNLKLLCESMLRF